MIKTFKGLIAHNTVKQVRLSTNNGLTGYKIVKFNLINKNIGDVDYSAVVKVYTREQDSVDNDVDFTDPTLVAVGYLTTDASSTIYPDDVVVIFDSLVFNQDIFVTCKQTGASGTDDCNYYLELEQVKLSENEATMATLKDMRSGPSSFV